jgi:hypothetical protein
MARTKLNQNKWQTTTNRRWTNNEWYLNTTGTMKESKNFIHTILSFAEQMKIIDDEKW